MQKIKKIFPEKIIYADFSLYASITTYNWLFKKKWKSLTLGSFQAPQLKNLNSRFSPQKVV